jgi:hypothetical protein
MAKPKRDPVREERIYEEVIVDAYGPEEQAMGWHYYLEDKIRFPFQAKCIASRVASPLRRGESIEVLDLAPEGTVTAASIPAHRKRTQKYRSITSISSP